MRDSQGGGGEHPSGGPKWRDSYSDGPDHPVATNRVESFFSQGVAKRIGGRFYFFYSARGKQVKKG